MGEQAEPQGRRTTLRKIAVVLAVLAALFFGGKALGWWGSADDGAFKLYGNVEIFAELAQRRNGDTVKGGEEGQRIVVNNQSILVVPELSRPSRVAGRSPRSRR